MRAEEILATALAVPIESVPGDASIDTFEPWDSLGHVAVIETLEAAIGRKLDANEVLTIVDLATIRSALERDGSAKAAR